MAFCSKCGAQVEDGQKFCPSCGAQLDAAPEAQSEKKEQGNVDLSEKISAALNSGADKTSQFDEKDINDNKVFALLSYFSWLVLIPIFAAKDSKFARFHANQGIMIAVFELVLFIIGLIPVLGWIVKFVGGIIAVIFSLMGIIAAAKGEAKELPLIGKYVILK